MTDQEKCLALILSEQPKKADAIILLEGDGLYRVKKAVELYKAKWAPVVVISGGLDDPKSGGYLSPLFIKALTNKGVRRQDILVEGEAQNTHEQATNIMALAKQRGWQKILLVASNFHQCRAYLTFLKVRASNRSKVAIINAPALDLPWFTKNTWGTRAELLTKEFEKIERYGTKGHIASWAEALAHQVWKEKNV